MTSAEIALVQSSFRRLRPVMDHVGTQFFARLLQLDPELRRQFDCDPVVRDRRLLQWVALTVNGLGHPATLMPVVRRAGRRSADLFLGYGRMETIWAALLGALEEGAGQPFGLETRNAWTHAYWFLANLLRDGAHEAGIAA